VSGSRYTELQVTTHFSFLRGASSCEELFATAAVMGVEALAVVDRNSLAGVVRAHEAAKTTGVRLVVGCRLDLTEGYSVLVYPTDRPAYSRLCRLLSLGKKRAGKARCELGWPDLVAYREGLIAVLVPDEADEDCAMRLRRLRDAFGDRAYMALKADISSTAFLLFKSNTWGVVSDGADALFKPAIPTASIIARKILV
jgi:error-prone DNA polymerase